MADIDVVPKHRSNTWVWIVLALVVAAILIWAFAGHSTRTASHDDRGSHLVAAQIDRVDGRALFV